MMRILVTGSREWTDEAKLYRVLDSLLNAEKDSLVIVHGDCPDGADKMAADWCFLMGVPPEPHPADWSLGRRAGYVRNAEMVKLGADLCVAFLTPGCKGTVHCAALAQAANIQTIAFFASK